MKQKKIFTWAAISLGVLSLAIMLFVNVNRAYPDSVNSQQEFAFKDVAVKTFNIDTTKAKPVYMREIFDDSVSELSSDIRYKCQDALNILNRDGTHKNGDFLPIFFIEGNDKVSIVIKHDDGSITLNEFDISKEEPTKLNYAVEEAQ